MPSSNEPGHFDESELVDTLQSLVGVLEDLDPKQRVYAYTKDATFIMPGVPPVHGREEMLQRLETGEVLWDVTITPYNIDGCHDVAYADGLLTCIVGRTEDSSGVATAMLFLMVLRKESDGVWRIAREFLSVPVSANPDDAKP